MSVELHPAVVHFALALLFFSVVFDFFGVMLTRDSLIWAGFWNLVGGVIAAVVAVTSGLLAEANLPARPPAGIALLALHEVAGFATFILFALLLAWRAALRGRIPVRGRTVYLAVAACGALIVLSGALLGGAMVYRHGLGVSPSIVKPELLSP